MAKKNQRNEDLVCKFCDREFSRASTLANHVCVKKQRFNDRDTIVSRTALIIFGKFHKLLAKSKSEKTVEDFISSPYYTSFVKLARYIIELNPVDKERFVEYLFKSNKTEKEWYSEATYFEYLKSFSVREPVEAALERTFLELGVWSEKNNTPIKDFFKTVSPVEGVYMMKSGKLSPWVLYLSNTAGELWDKIYSEKQLVDLVALAVDPDLWASIFSAKQQDVAYVKGILDEVGI